MVFACQQNSYAAELETRVLSCTPAKCQLVVQGKKTKLDGFEVILEDTVLFPEGGGQPDDHGTIGGVEVLRVTRRGAQAVHFTEEALQPGQPVQLKVNWQRRWHHMQQHSGQHLITAVLDQLFGFQTTSWALRDSASFIELDTSAISRDQLVAGEDRANQLIRESRPVNVTVHLPGDEQLKDVRARGLPEDHTGDVRLVHIEGVDSNMCCGTHVSNLSHLQAVKLLYAETGKKGRTNVFFLVGQRLLDYLGEAVARESQLNVALKCSPVEYVSMVEKHQRVLKQGQRTCRQLLKQLAEAEVDRFRRQGTIEVDRKSQKTNGKPSGDAQTEVNGESNAEGRAPDSGADTWEANGDCSEMSRKTPEVGRFLSVHQPAGDAEFMATVVSLLDDETVLKVLTVGGEDGGSGSLLLHGPPALVATLGPRLCDLLQGKGAGKGNRFTAKLTCLKKRVQADTLVREALRKNAASKAEPQQSES